MHEANAMLQRISTLSTLTAISSAKCTIQAVPNMGRFALRLPREAGHSILNLAGIDIDLPINRSSHNANGIAARLGPDEWLLIIPDASIERFRAEAATQLANQHHALVDVSHRNCAIKITGAAAIDVLAAGCPIDFGDAHFPPHAATRTLLGRVEIVLCRMNDTADATGVLQPCFHVECWRSFGRYVHAYLVEAVREHSAV